MRLHQESCVMVLFLWPGRSGKHQILFFSSAGPWTGEACLLSPIEETENYCWLMALQHVHAQSWLWQRRVTGHCYLLHLWPDAFLRNEWPRGDQEMDRSWPQLRSFFLEYCRSLRILSAGAERRRQCLYQGFEPHGNPSLSPTSQDHRHSDWKFALRLPNLPLISTAVLKSTFR